MMCWRTQKLVAHDDLLLENAKAAYTLIEVEFFILSLHMMGMTLTVDFVEYGS